MSEQEPIERSVDERWAKWGAWALPPTVVLVAIAGGFIQGPAFTALTLAAGAMLGAIVAFWSSIRALFGETQLSGEDAFAMGAPSVEEEQKRAVLRAIKDLEFERGVGKISEDDYQLFIAKYRAEAKRLLRVIDDRQEPQRVRVEALVQKYLRDHGDTEEAPAAEDESTRVCASCEASNDTDATFCKKCGKRLAPAEEDDSEAPE